MRFDTQAIHLGRSVDPSTGAVSIPLNTSTTFERGPDGSFPSGYEYTRDSNPTRFAFEQAMAAPEGGGGGAAFASGLAAIAAVLEAHPSKGRVVLPDDSGLTG